MMKQARWTIRPLISLGLVFLVACHWPSDVWVEGLVADTLITDTGITDVGMTDTVGTDCQPDETMCHDGDIYKCKSDGTGYSLFRDCKDGCESGVCQDTDDAEIHDAEDAELDVFNPPACVSNDDECIGRLELGQCQQPFCNTEIGLCEAVNRDDNEPCSDGDFCTGPDKCTSGSCVAGPVVSCFDDNDCTLDDCQESIGCVNTKLNTGGCDDGNTCTIADACGNGECVGAEYSCNDDRGCTQDLCDGAGGCQHPAIDGTCLIDGVCAVPDDSDPDDPCRQCIPGVNQYDWSDVEDGTIVPGAPVWYRDFDGDLYGDSDVTQQVCGQPQGYVAVIGDCNDADDQINPGETDLCDHVDTDCDGMTDGDYVSTPTTCGLGQCRSSGTLECIGGVETDSCEPGDTAEEICDGLDNDCNGVTDPANLTGCVIYHKDKDSDEYGTSESLCLCAPTAQYTATNGNDCCDTDALVHPGSTTFRTFAGKCGSFDYNCDGSVTKQFVYGTGSCGGILYCHSDMVEGWIGAAPDCGQTGTFLENCTLIIPSTCEQTTQSLIQGCY